MGETLSLSEPRTAQRNCAAHHKRSGNSGGYKLASILSSGGSAEPTGGSPPADTRERDLPSNSAGFSCPSAASGDFLAGGFLEGPQPLWLEHSLPVPHSPSPSLSEPSRASSMTHTSTRGTPRPQSCKVLPEPPTGDLQVTLARRKKP